MKSFTSNWVFKDVVSGSGWTDESSEKLAKNILVKKIRLITFVLKIIK
jgi:hypothetical protein